MSKKIPCRACGRIRGTKVFGSFCGIVLAYCPKHANLWDMIMLEKKMARKSIKKQSQRQIKKKESKQKKQEEKWQGII